MALTEEVPKEVTEAREEMPDELVPLTHREKVFVWVSIISGQIILAALIYLFW